MKKIIAHITLFLLAATLLTACTDNDFPASAPEQGRLVVTYSVATTQTRATEAGWGSNDWNENTVNRLDLFVIDNEGNAKHYNTPSTYSYADPQNGNYETLDVSDVITLADVRNSQAAYLVANCPSVANCSTLKELQTAMTAGGFVYNRKQTESLFIMDAKGRKTIDGDNITLSFDLERALAKIRIGVETVITENNIQSPSYSLDNITYRMYNYATSTHVLSEAETYNNPRPDASDNFEGISPNQTYNDDGSPKFVLYSYPNDWFDTKKEHKNGDRYSIDDLHNEAPIVEAKQTYVLLRAPYNGEYGYYKVPVNKQLPDIHDNRTFSEEEYNSIRDLYRLRRNHLYDISVTIDSPGGPIEDPVIPDFSIRINDWTEGGDYTLSPDDFI